MGHVKRVRGNAVSKKCGSRRASKKEERKMKTPCKVQMDQSDASSGDECIGCNDLIAEPCQLCGLHYTCKHCTETCPCEKFFETHCRHCRKEVSESCTTGFCDTCIEVEKVCPNCWIAGGGSHDTFGTECPGNGRECRKCYHDAVAQGCSETETCRVCYVKYRDEMSNSCRYCKNPMRCMPAPFWFEDCHECTVCRSTFNLNSQEGGGPYDPSKCWVQFYQPPCLTCGELVEPRPVLQKEWYNHTSGWLDRSIAPQCRACKKRRNRSLTLLALKSVYEAGLESCIPFDVRTHLCPKAKLDWNPAFSSM
jgi:hypothetical protein